MSKACPACGFQNMDDDLFCGSCGAKMSGAATPVRRRASSAPQNPAVMVARTIMKFIPFILFAMIIFSVIQFCMNITGNYDVTATAIMEYEGEKEEESASGLLSDLYETEQFTGLAVTGVVYAVFHMVLAVLALLMVINVFRGNRKIRRSLNRYSLIGLIGSVVYLILFWITGTGSDSMYGMTLTLRVAPHFTAWISVVLFAMLFALNKLSKPARKRR